MSDVGRGAERAIDNRRDSGTRLHGLLCQGVLEQLVFENIRFTKATGVIRYSKDGRSPQCGFHLTEYVVSHIRSPVQPTYILIC